MDYDVIYIGSGNAAWQGGRFLRKAGLKILIIEESLYGGTCANRGCNSKALLDAPYEIRSLIFSVISRISKAAILPKYPV